MNNLGEKFIKEIQRIAEYPREEVVGFVCLSVTRTKQDSTNLLGEPFPKSTLVPTMTEMFGDDVRFTPEARKGVHDALTRLFAALRPVLEPVTEGDTAHG